MEAIPSSCGILVYRETTSRVTRMVWGGRVSGIFKIYDKKSVESLM